MDVHRYMWSKPVWSTSCGTNDPLIALSALHHISLTVFQWHSSGFKTYFWLWYCIIASHTLYTGGITNIPHQKPSSLKLTPEICEHIKTIRKIVLKKKKKKVKSQGNYSVRNNLRLHHPTVYLKNCNIINFKRTGIIIHQVPVEWRKMKKIKTKIIKKKITKNNSPYLPLSRPATNKNV